MTEITEIVEFKQEEEQAEELTEEQIKTNKEIELGRRQRDAEKLCDPIEKDLLIRYNMDPIIWRKAQRHQFPYNTSLKLIVGIPLVIPILYLLVDMALVNKNFEYVKLTLQTLGMSLATYYLCDQLIDVFKGSLCQKGLFGRDLNKAGVQKDKDPVPEALGIVISIIFLCSTILQQITLSFTQERLIEYNAGLLAICMVVLLGFVDDVIDLKWRHKIIVPMVASLPLLVAYKGLTSVIVPKPFRTIFGNTADLGILYYFYMGNIAIFCTNAINIYAGINGIEVGQSFIIGCFIIIHNIIEIKLNYEFAETNALSESTLHYHLFSLTIMIPFCFATLALLKHNQFPSKVFVGDTFCYCAGMTFAVVGILGHFSKTMMLFFIPQLLNFVFSIPQILGIVHCPRHRLPKFNHESYLLECVHNHHTLINAWLRVFGSTNESQLCNALLIFQIFCCSVGLFIRYFVSSWFF